jgi:hypothetical protein
VDTEPEYLHVKTLAGEFASTDFELKNLIATADLLDVRARSLAI